MEGLLSIISAIIALLITLRIFAGLWWRGKTVPFKIISQDVDSDSGYSRHKINAIVIGGQGLLGKKLVQSLIADGIYTVHSLDLFIPPESDRLAGVKSYIQTDITNEDNITKALKGMDTVFLTASLQPCVTISDSLMRKVNVDGARNVIKACKLQGVSRLIYTSSVSVTMSKYPEKPHNLIQESEPFPEVPLNAYVETKRNAELMVRGANGINGLNTVALRLAGLMGGKRNPTMSLMMGPILAYGGNGDYAIDYVDIDSAVRAHIMAEKKLCTEQQEKSLKKTLLASNGSNGLSNGSNGVSNGLHKNGTHHKSVSIAGKAYIISMPDKCSLKEMMQYVTELRGVMRPFGIPHVLLLPIACLNRLLYLATGLVITPFTLMHVEFLRAFNFVPDLAYEELGWVDKKSWKEIAQKALREY